MRQGEGWPDCGREAFSPWLDDPPSSPPQSHHGNKWASRLPEEDTRPVGGKAGTGKELVKGMEEEGAERQSQFLGSDRCVGVHCTGPHALKGLESFSR